MSKKATPVEEDRPRPSFDDAKTKIFREMGESAYEMQVLPAGITFAVERLHRERHDLTGEVAVSVNPQNFPLARHYNGMIAIGDLNFSSVQARSSRGKLLEERSGRPFDWYGLLEEFVMKVMSAERMGKPGVVMADIELPTREQAEQWTIGGIPILQDLPMVLYGDASSGKSYLSLWIAGQLAQRFAQEPEGGAVGYIDWEFDGIQHKKRLDRLFKPAPRNIIYIRCDSSMHHQTDRLMRLIKQHNIRYAVCDSIGFAIDGPAEAQDSARLYFKALRSLGIGTMNLAHIPKAQDGREAQIFGCYSDDTEVLTYAGWKNHRAVTLEDKVMCFDPATESVRYENPEHVHAYRYTGQMVKISTSSTEALVTPNHRCLVQHPEHGRPQRKAGNLFKPEWTFIEARDLPREVRVPIAGTPAPHAKQAYVSDAFVRLIGWWIAEGSFNASKTSFTLAQASGPLAERMIETLRELEIAATVTRSKNRKRPHELEMCYITSRRTRAGRGVTDWLRRECGVGAAGKRLPASTWSLPPSKKAVLLEALIDGDGSRLSYGGRLYHTVSRQLADDVQRLSIELGMAASVRWDPPGKPHHQPRATVKISRPERKTVALYPRHRSDVFYDGMVYCLTVPTGAYVTRRKGKMAIYGNSVFFKAGARSAWFVDKASDNPRGELRCGVHHRKSNIGALLSSRGFRLVFEGEHTTRIETIDPKTVDELTVQLPLLDRVKRELSREKMTQKGLAETLDVPIGSIKSILSRHKSQFIKLGNSYGVLAAGEDF